MAFSGLGFLLSLHMALKFSFAMQSLLAIPSLCFTDVRFVHRRSLSGITAAAFCRDYWVYWKVSLNSMTVSLLTCKTYPHAFKSP